MNELAGALPLHGLTVLNLAEQYPGPYATLVFSDLGADVISVERPAGDDPSRQFPGFFEALNRGKRSIALDLKSVDGRHALLELVRVADVLLDGFRPGTMARLDLDWPTLKVINPRLVYASITGYGQDGPYRDRPAHDLSYLATTGALYERLGGGGPGFPGTLAIGDLSSGMFAAIGILTALLQRERTGEGAYVDVSMTDGLVSWMTTRLVPVMNGLPLADFNSEPAYDVFATEGNGQLTLSIAHEDAFWRRLCDVVGLDDVRNLQAPERVARSAELKQRLAALIRTRTREEWVAVLDPAGVPMGPVLGLDEVVDDPHVVARRLVVEVPADDRRPARRHVRQPVLIDGRGGAPARHAPELGEHTREILAWAGFDENAIDKLIAGGGAAGF